MSRNTTHFGLQVIEPGDDPFQNGHKFFAADRDTIDTIMWLMGSGHVHDGATGSIAAPDDPLDLTLETTGGQIGAGARVWYTYTLVNAVTGLETGPGPAAFVDTPAPIEPPDSPTLSWGSLDGTLIAGQYYYILSAWTDVNTNETQGVNAVGVIVPVGTSTNRVIIDLPELPDGADGFNIYRREPGGRNYLHLVALEDGVDDVTQYVDDGTVEEDCDRVVRSRNNTNSTNTVLAAFPVTVTLPDGYIWKLYRTVAEADWSASLLQVVAEETEEGSGIITTEFLDEGLGTNTGEPPSGSYDYDSPSKILLTDGANVEGTLPMGMTAFPFVVTFGYPGTLEVLEGLSVWRCPFPGAEIISVSATLGKDAAPASTDVIVDVNYFDPYGAAVWDTIFTTQANRPRITVGNQIGDAAYPDVNYISRDTILTADIDQTGGGATPTDENLTVTIYMIVQIPVGTSYVYDPTPGGNAGNGY